MRTQSAWFAIELTIQGQEIFNTGLRAVLIKSYNVTGEGFFEFRVGKKLSFEQQLASLGLEHTQQCRI